MHQTLTRDSPKMSSRYIIGLAVIAMHGAIISYDNFKRNRVTQFDIGKLFITLCPEENSRAVFERVRIQNV